MSGQHVRLTFNGNNGINQQFYIPNEVVWPSSNNQLSENKLSLRADEIKLWLTPSAKQRRNPCTGLPAVYPDLSTRHDWLVKKGLCFVVVIANQVEGKFETHLQ